MQNMPPDATQSADVASTFQEILANPSQASELLQPIMTGLLGFGAKIVGALIVLAIGFWIAGRIRAAVRSAMGRSPRLDETLAGFLASLAYYGAVALVIITTLGVFGVPTTSFAAVIGAAGIAIGLAMQGTLGNVASGVMLLMFRPFDVGDYVDVGGIAGSVRGLNLFFTELSTVDNRKIIIPNGQIWDNAITNFSANETRRLDLVLGVGYDANLDAAIEAVRAEIEADPRAHADPAPVIEVDNWGASSVDLTVRTWCAGADYFVLKWSLLKKVKERFDREGIPIPFPTRTIHMVKSDDD